MPDKEQVARLLEEYKELMAEIDKIERELLLVAGGEKALHETKLKRAERAIDYITRKGTN